MKKSIESFTFSHFRPDPLAPANEAFLNLYLAIPSWGRVGTIEAAYNRFQRVARYFLLARSASTS